MFLKVFVLVEIFVICHGLDRVINQTCLNIRIVPYLVSVERVIVTNKMLPLMTYHWCLGTILKTDAVLTTARCVSVPDEGSGKSKFKPFNPQELYIIAGVSHLVKNCEFEKNDNYQRIAVSQIHIHDSYDPKTEVFDIAGLKIRDHLRLGEFVKLTPFATFDSRVPWETYKGKNCFSIGWRITTTAISYNLCLHPVHAVMLDDKACSDNVNIYAPGRRVHQNEMCGVGSKTHHCGSDPSSCLICEDKFIGFSAAVLCDVHGRSPIGLYAYTNEYKDFVVRKLDVALLPRSAISGALKLQFRKFWIVILAMTTL